MKKQLYSHSRSGIFLMEIIVAILFFSLASAICLNLFVYSRNLSRDTGNLNFAVSQISSIANVLTYAESAEQAEELLSSQYQAEPAAVFFIYYDDTYQLCSADKASYTITVTPVDTENRIYTWTIKMYGSDAGAISLSDASADSEDSIYELQVEVYYAE